jgi:hypothetical protein
MDSGQLASSQSRTSCLNGSEFVTWRSFGDASENIDAVATTQITAMQWMPLLRMIRVRRGVVGFHTGFDVCHSAVYRVADKQVTNLPEGRSK